MSRKKVALLIHCALAGLTHNTYFCALIKTNKSKHGQFNFYSYWIIGCRATIYAGENGMGKEAESG